MAATAAKRRVRVRVSGTVQGVRFRPFVYRLAHELDLVGWVLNEAEGSPGAVTRFLARLEGEALPLAAIETVEPRDLLLERTAAALAGGDLRVLIPERLPPNDGGISFGQVAIAAAMLRER